MPLEIVRNDIANMRVDILVNTANPKPIIGSGTDARIHARAGHRLLEARKRLGDIAVGHSALTEGYDLDAKWVIHTVGSRWRGGLLGEGKLLRSCYDSALALAKQKGAASIAFPLIASGNYGFPKDKALQIAIAAFSEFLLENEMQIYLVVFDDQSFRLSEKLFDGVKSYVDANYVQQMYSAPAYRDRDVWETRVACSEAPKAASLPDFLKQADAGFTETLLKLIDKKGKKDSEIYKKANLSKQHFSKIRNNPDYKPTKQTAIALALALELDLEATKDLIGRAGYALSNSSKFDLIIRYFIEQGNYNVVEINMALYEFDQSLLGS